MSEKRIARFVDMNACESIFSDYSTFVLRSEQYYREMEHATGKSDKQELEVRYPGGGGAWSSGYVLSCWTMLDGDEPTQDEWCIFGNSVVAIISTPSKICEFLGKTFLIENGSVSDKRRFPFFRIKHQAVKYADEVDKVSPADIEDKTVFTKRSQFANQKEYRFALPYSIMPHSIISYIFSVAHDEYVERRFANPGMCDTDKSKLVSILLRAMAGYGPFQRDVFAGPLDVKRKMCEIVANAHILFP